MEKAEPAVILLVEDDPGDQKLVRVSLINQGSSSRLFVVANGEEALDFLYRHGRYDEETPRPCLILLDLRMPGMGGIEFLRRVKNDENLKMIPVIVLSSSDSEQDILDSYRLHASGYIGKPMDAHEFRRVMKEIEQYWLVICKLPGSRQIGN